MNWTHHHSEGGHETITTIIYKQTLKLKLFRRASWSERERERERVSARVHSECLMRFLLFVGFVCKLGETLWNKVVFPFGSTFWAMFTRCSCEFVNLFFRNFMFTKYYLLNMWVYSLGTFMEQFPILKCYCFEFVIPGRAITQ